MQEITFSQGIYFIETVTGKKFTEDQINIYKKLLSDIPDDNFTIGINNMLRERVFSNLPMPAEIRQYCLGLKEDELQVKINLARTHIQKALSEVGTYNDVVFDDPVIHLCINAIGGWISLGTKPLKEFEDWLKWELPKLYKGFSGRKNHNIPLVLEGKAGKDFKTLTYIGNKEKALKWTNAYMIQIEKKENQAINSLVNKMAV